jgi:hypothetical protein
MLYREKPKKGDVREQTSPFSASPFARQGSYYKKVILYIFTS